MRGNATTKLTRVAGVAAAPSLVCPVVPPAKPPAGSRETSIRAEAQRSAIWRHRDPRSAAGNAAMPRPSPSNTSFTVGALLAGLPCGYCFGEVAAFVLMGGPEIGRAPLLTVPAGLLAATVFALLPFLEAQTRFVTMVVAAIAGADVFLMVRSAFP
jgi:hypothetical protein